MVRAEVFRPIGIFHAPAMHTIEGDGGRGVPLKPPVGQRGHDVLGDGSSSGAVNAVVGLDHARRRSGPRPRGWGERSADAVTAARTPWLLRTASAFRPYRPQVARFAEAGLAMDTLDFTARPQLACSLNGLANGS